MQRLQRHFPIAVYMAYVWLGAGAIIGAISLIFVHQFVTSTIGVLVLGGVASWAGMYCYNLSIKHQANLGYVEAASSSRAISSYCLSLVFFGAVVEPVRLGAIVGVIAGVVLVAHSRHGAGPSRSRIWVLWAVVAGILFCCVAASTRIAVAAGTDTYAATSIVMLVAGVLYVITAALGGLDWKPTGRTSALWLAIGFAVVGNIAAVTAFVTAPNLAYPLAINSSRIVLLYAISLITGTDKLEPRRLLGMALTFAAVAAFNLGPMG